MVVSCLFLDFVRMSDRRLDSLKRTAAPPSLMYDSFLLLWWTIWDNLGKATIFPVSSNQQLPTVVGNQEAGSLCHIAASPNLHMHRARHQKCQGKHRGDNWKRVDDDEVQRNNS